MKPSVQHRPLLDILPFYSDEMDSGVVFLLTLCDQFMSSRRVSCSNISEYGTGGSVWRLLSCRHVDNQKLLKGQKGCATLQNCLNLTETSGYNETEEYLIHNISFPPRLVAFVLGKRCRR